MTDQKEVKEETKPKESSKEEQKQEIAKVYGISLADIEEIILADGTEVFKFYNAEDRTMKMIENRPNGYNLSQQFKDIQQRLTVAQGDNSIQNARAIFDYQLQNQKIELTLIPARELLTDTSKYQYILRSLNPEQLAEVRILIANVERLDLEYINLEHTFGIDKQHKVLDAEYNHQTNRCDIKSAEVRNYETNQVTDDNNDYSFEIPTTEFDDAVVGVDFDGIDVPSEDPNIEEAEEKQNIERGIPSRDIVIRGYHINRELLKIFYESSEDMSIIDRCEMSNEEKLIYKGLVSALVRKKNAKMKNMQPSEKQNTDGYQKKLLPPNANQQNRGYADAIVLVLIAGVISGMAILLVVQTLLRMI